MVSFDVLDRVSHGPNCHEDTADDAVSDGHYASVVGLETVAAMDHL